MNLALHALRICCTVLMAVVTLTVAMMCITEPWPVSIVAAAGAYVPFGLVFDMWQDKI